MLVICLEGCHGCGKTELCQHLAAAGLSVLDEAFIDTKEESLHPQSLIMEMAWVSAWFQRLLELHHAANTGSATDGEKHEASDVYFCDRSPFSAVLYARGEGRGRTLDPLLKAMIAEMNEETGISLVTVHVDVNSELLWRRISERLKYVCTLCCSAHSFRAK